ncbi:uncharacterized protein TNCV_3049301 [Trichonephila clavipes]|nr:uncharacterized protein TNCV_3049301 [Trichonephila clavipes]
MIAANINVADGLANGAVGKLSHVELRDQNRVLRVWFSFPNGVGVKGYRVSQALGSWSLAPIPVKGFNGFDSTRISSYRDIYKQQTTRPSSQKLISYFMLPENKSIEIVPSSDESDFELIHHRALDYDE